MVILLIAFAVIFALDWLITNRIKYGDFIERLYYISKYKWLLVFLTIVKYILGATIIIKIILKFFE